MKVNETYCCEKDGKLNTVESKFKIFFVITISSREYNLSEVKL